MLSSIAWTTVSLLQQQQRQQIARQGGAAAFAVGGGIGMVQALSFRSSSSSVYSIVHQRCHRSAIRSHRNVSFLGKRERVILHHHNNRPASSLFLSSSSSSSHCNTSTALNSATAAADATVTSSLESSSMVNIESQGSRQQDVIRVHLSLVVGTRNGKGEHSRRRIHDQETEGPISPLLLEGVDQGVIPRFQCYHVNDKDEASYVGRTVGRSWQRH